MKVICVDSDYDKAARVVAEWRRSNTYEDLKVKVAEITILRDGSAKRDSFMQELTLNEGAFVSGSGHGFYEKFIGDDMKPLLEVNDYNRDEVEGKIIHLLSCNTAFMLGKDLVKNGCKAFFGYDLPFTFHIEYLEDFMSPSRSLDLSITDNDIAEIGHIKVIEEYDRVIQKMESEDVNVYIIGDIMTNKEHFCSPSKNNVWGDPSASFIEAEV